VIGPGDPVPDVRVWRSTREAVGLRELAAAGPYLLLFYLFDWSST
jgi:peroxiredoxin